jgi:cyclase
MPLAKRIIPILLVRDGMLVKGRQFKSDRVVGSVIQAVKVFESRQADELVILDVGATPARRGPDFEFMRSVCDEAFMPLTIGGGVRTVGDIRGLLNAGADKVVIHSAIIEREAAEIFGSNCIVVSLDVGRGFCTGEPSAVSAAQFIERQGGGEILLQSIDRDGMMTGYNLELIRKVAKVLSIPLVASSGCRDYEDMYQAIQAGADAVAAGALWQFTDATPLEAKKYLRAKGVNVRLT